MPYNFISFFDAKTHIIESFLTSKELALLNSTSRRFYLSQESEVQWIMKIVHENKYELDAILLLRIINPNIRSTISPNQLQNLIKTPKINFKIRLMLLLYHLKIVYQNTDKRNILLKKMFLLTYNTNYTSLIKIVVAHLSQDTQGIETSLAKVLSKIDAEDIYNCFMIFPPNMLKVQLHKMLLSYYENDVVTYQLLYKIRNIYPNAFSSAEWDKLIKDIYKKGNHHTAFVGFPCNNISDLIAHFKRLHLIHNQELGIKVYYPLELLTIAPLEGSFKYIKVLAEKILTVRNLNVRTVENIKDRNNKIVWVNHSPLLGKIWIN